MLNETVQVQEHPEIIEARKSLKSVLAYGRDSSRCEVYQGVYLEDLQARYHTIEPDATWKEFVVGYCNMSYRTARRRIKAAEWHTILQIDLDKLSQVDVSRLEQYRDMANEENAQEMYHDLLPLDDGGLSDADFIAKWKGEQAPVEPKEPVVKIVRVCCPRCEANFDAQLA